LVDIRYLLSFLLYGIQKVSPDEIFIPKTRKGESGWSCMDDEKASGCKCEIVLKAILGSNPDGGIDAIAVKTVSISLNV